MVGLLKEVKNIDPEPDPDPNHIIKKIENIRNI
jgi:hypothetical protein